MIRSITHHFENPENTKSRSVRDPEINLFSFCNILFILQHAPFRLILGIRKIRCTV